MKIFKKRKKTSKQQEKEKIKKELRKFEIYEPL